MKNGFSRHRSVFGMKRLSNIIFMFVLLSVPLLLSAADKSAFDFSRSGGFSSKKTAVAWEKQIKQGYNFQIWMNNGLILGKQAFDDGNPPFDIRNSCGSQGIGADYPVGACIEHLFGAGPWIGGIQDGVRKVSEGYNGDQGIGYLIPERKDTARDRIWETSVEDTVATQFGY